MILNKPFATISYNSKNFLKSRCDKLIKDGFISFYMFIPHHFAEDEKRSHIHLYVIPKRPIEDDFLRHFFTETLLSQDGNVIKSISCLSMIYVSFKEFYLYSFNQDMFDDNIHNLNDLFDKSSMVVSNKSILKKLCFYYGLYI